MASSAFSRLITLALAGGLLAGCAVLPTQQTAGGQASAQHGLTPAQQTTFQEGAAALTAGRANKAVQIFKQLVKADPTLAAAHANLGTALMMRGDDALAASAFARATALDPTLATAWVRLGVLRAHSGQFDKAEAAYKAALAQDPDNRYAHLDLGILYDKYLQKPRQALAQYKRFQKLSDQPDKEVARWIKNLKQRL